MIEKRRAAALVMTIIAIAFFSMVGMVLVMRSIQEYNLTTRYVDSVKAFWLAEAGIATGYSELMNDSTYNGVVWTSLASGDYRVIRSASSGSVEIRAEAISGSGTQDLSFTLAFVPYPFENTMSAGDDIALTGFIGNISVWGKTRLSGSFSKSGIFTSAWFEDKVEAVDPEYTSMPISDYDGNGTADEFSDFVIMNQEILADHPAEEVVYVQSNGTVNIFPNDALIGKKVIYVEGDNPGQGNVNIFFDASWEDQEDLTVISTGEITYTQPLQFQEDSRLSTISWGDYSEISIFQSTHESVIYTHEDAHYADILDWGSTTGNIIAQENISIVEFITNEKFYYSDRALNGDLPPGYGRLASTSGVLSSKMMDWQERYD